MNAKTVSLLSAGERLLDKILLLSFTQQASLGILGGRPQVIPGCHFLPPPSGLCPMLLFASLAPAAKF